MVEKLGNAYTQYQCIVVEAVEEPMPSKWETKSITGFQWKMHENFGNATLECNLHVQFDRE